MSVMSNSTFQIIYDGPALASHEMEVRDLAPALLALGSLFEEANSAIYGEKTKVSVNVRGSFKTGSFGIDVHVAHSLFNQVKDWLAGPDGTASANLIAFIMFGSTGGTGVIGLIKWLKGRAIGKIEVLESGNVKVTIDDGHIEVEKQVIDLYLNWRLRKALEEVISKPLQKEGIDSFAVRIGKDDFLEVTKSDSVLFNAPAQEEEIIEESEREANLQLVNIAFRDENKWRFYDGAATFYASVADTDFLNRVDFNQETFSKGDILKVKLFERKVLHGTEMKAEYTVLQILEHRRGATQLKLPMAPRPEDQ